MHTSRLNLNHPATAAPAVAPVAFAVATGPVAATVAATVASPAVAPVAFAEAIGAVAATAAATAAALWLCATGVGSALWLCGCAVALLPRRLELALRLGGCAAAWERTVVGHAPRKRRLPIPRRQPPRRSFRDRFPFSCGGTSFGGNVDRLLWQSFRECLCLWYRSRARAGRRLLGCQTWLIV